MIEAGIQAGLLSADGIAGDSPYATASLLEEWLHEHSQFIIHDIIPVSSNGGGVVVIYRKAP